MKHTGNTIEIDFASLSEIFLTQTCISTLFRSGRGTYFNGISTIFPKITFFQY
jgi:hypothetical protein